MYFPHLELRGWSKRSGIPPKTIYYESSAFIVKFLINASISPLAGQPMPMHINTHAPKPFMNGGALRKRMGISSELP